MKFKHRFVGIGTLVVLLLVLGFSQLQAQEEVQKITLQEFMDRVLGIVLGLQEDAERLAEVAAEEKEEVRALETRVAALETAMPWPTATPTVTPTPTPFPDEARNFAQQLAIGDYAGLFSDFSHLSEDERDRIITVYQDYFLKTSEVCELDLGETYKLIQKYAEPIDWYSPPALEARLQNMGMPRAGWRFDYIARIATNDFIQGMIRDDGGCNSYLEWYTSG